MNTQEEFEKLMAQLFGCVGLLLVAGFLIWLLSVAPVPTIAIIAFLWFLNIIRL